MDPLGNLINGMMFALGTVIVTTIAMYIGFKKGTKFMTDIIGKIMGIWNKAKEEGLKLDGISVDAKVKTKKLFKKKDEK